MYRTLQFDFGLNDLDVHSRSQGYGKARTCGVRLHEATQMLVIVDHVMEMTMKKP